MYRSFLVGRTLLRLTLLALLLVAPATAQGPGRLEIPLSADTGSLPTPQGELGTLAGVVLQDASCDNQAQSAIFAVAGALIEVSGGTSTSTVVTDADGAYQLSVPEGTYQVQASTPGGQVAVTQVDVAGGSSVHLNFTLDSADDTLSPSLGATLVADGDPDPDIDASGVVDFEDLDVVTNNAGLDVSMVDGELSGDVNGDGIVDDVDIQVVRAAFGRTVLRTSSHYQAEITAGGSTATLGDGLATVSSGEGYTLGRLELTGDPAVARFVIEEDRGTATSPELGDFDFTENPADPTSILFELSTGRVVGGRMTLLLNGGPFATTYPVDSVIPDGVVTFSPGGFERYQMVNVNGTLPSLPLLGTTAFAMCKKEKKKKDKACETVAATCGTMCAVNATCAKNGKCGTCRTVRVRKYDWRGRLTSDRCWCECQ